jgi:cobalt-zinc-cadmium efflux system outer membrane protein
MLASVLSAPLHAADDKTPASLTLSQAIDRVLAHNALLDASRQEIGIAQAEQRQAGLRPNPDFSVEVEGFGGSGPWAGFDGAETTLAVSQPIETAGKRTKRQRVTGARLQQAEFAYAGQRQRLRAQATRAFYAVLAAQEERKLAGQNLELAQRLEETVSQRVAAGKDSPIKQTQTLIMVSEQRMGLEEAKVNLSTARQHLAAHWGSTEPRFASVRGDFTGIETPPTAAQVLARWEAHPITGQWQAAVSEAKASLDLAKAEPVPDVTVVGGYKRMEDIGQNTAVLGLALPLPLFNRGQGARERATLTLGRTRRLQQQAQVTLITDLKTRHRRLTAAATQARELLDTILPHAEQAYAASITPYEQGKFDYLEILEAQRTLFETKRHALHALARYHEARADLDELIAQDPHREPLDSPGGELR